MLAGKLDSRLIVVFQISNCSAKFGAERLNIDRVELLDVAPSHVQYRDHVIDHNTHLKVSPRYDIDRTQIRYDIDLARTLSRYK